MMNLEEVKLEIFASQNEIITLQSEAINDLIHLLVQHKGIDDAEFAPIKEKIDKAAMLRAEIGT